MVRPALEESPAKALSVSPTSPDVAVSVLRSANRYAVCLPAGAELRQCRSPGRSQDIAAAQAG